MTQEEISTEIRRTPLFGALLDDQFARVMQGMHCHQLAKGERLFSQGEPVQSFYFLRRGLVKLFRTSPDGDEKVVELVSSGQIFAEALMFMGGDAAYPLHAESVDISEVLSFDAHAFVSLLRDSPETSFRMMATLSRRLHQFLNEIDSLSLRNATYRLVIYLLQQLPVNIAESTSIHLPATKNLIASKLSIQPETLSRILHRLRDRGLIEVQGNDIVLCDIHALRSMTDIDD
ncbi:hypothetical protein BOW53_14950 [Solemya pervernicosa gill symbiont]|uniref:Crp/Fnr family transcriptional regulator n=2 Tax=Gammaproteobacteria incertae sedis TaxID=118884 RepID=A0A1T2L0W8_9GAMM|nr:Crp/Fnr family transcriptional regulator [Candidatus Reidiella endopervernicosa]OOZ38596.1 hypothetical protein BOW53_14950 [Solemya pervernicosa gill symbiont]QKQ24950.1 Crp/Fnr family transcriptional regulator [Candidatus Reidiella endopervernicosa]